MKVHIGVDADSDLVHTVPGTSANVNDVVEANCLVHGQEIDGYADAGYQGADKRPDMPESTPERKFQWHIAMKRGQRKALDLHSGLATANPSRFISRRTTFSEMSVHFLSRDT